MKLLCQLILIRHTRPPQCWSKQFKMENHRSPILVSQSASKDVSKNAEPPPKLIFCCLRNLRYSTVLTTFCIEPNNTIVEVTFRFRREKKNSPPGHIFLGRDKISKHMKGKHVCFSFLSFCYLNTVQWPKCLRPVKVCNPGQMPALSYLWTFVLWPASSITNPGI